MRKRDIYNLLCPNLYLGSVFELPLEQLRKQGVIGLIFDLDNTLLNWNTYRVTTEARALFNRLEQGGFRSCLVSNNKRNRVEVVASALALPFIPKARKPGRKAFRQAMAALDTTVSSTAVIGDQLFTDVLGGNRLGLYTILVMPLCQREFVGTKVTRSLERLVMAKLVQKGMIKKPITCNR